MTDQELLDLAFKALENAYAPYSNYRVGACVLCKDGKTFPGANIENASYGATNCAERTAIFSAYANGYRRDDIEAIAIVCEGSTMASPCGICRQVLSELIPGDAKMILANREKSMVTNIEALLPLSFGSKDLQ
ncbi:MAG: cytidine deaminase [Erysipelotrichaceae bacterium]|nr:cytidine deaminase [Erysipelotrichaceae bacterium]